MKRTLIAVLTVAALTGFATLSFAQKAQSPKSNMESVKGEIVSVDASNNQVTIKETGSNTQKTVSVEPKAISTLKVGEQVRAKVKSGSTKAESIKVVTPKKGKK